MATGISRAAGTPQRWARLRFSIIGPLLASPAEPGELAARLLELSAKTYRHPTTGEAVRFGVSTLERWYYAVKDAGDPVAALARKVHAHAGSHPAMPAELAAVLEAQHRTHPRWSFQLHHDNLGTLVREKPALGPLPSYTTVRRFMRDRGWLRHRKKPRKNAEAHEARETRSFEVSHVHALWHLDFHDGSRKVLTTDGKWKTPQLLGVLDDRSRLCCHLQWYLDETADSLVHGLSQAIAKRGLPRALLSDNGAAMQAAELTEGLERLGIMHHTTLPYSPEQNAKQEVFWAQVEGRLMPMLEGEPDLTLALLNTATQSWVEGEYQRRTHSELGDAPLDAALAGPSVVRPSPSSDGLRRAFRMQTTRAVRRSDGTFTLGAVRFELPWQYRSLVRITVRLARWDLSAVDLVDPRSGAHLAQVLPLDKAKNAESRRRTVASAPPHASAPAPAGIAPLLRELMADYAATGLPPAYLPKHDVTAELGELGEDAEQGDDNPSDPETP